MKNIAVVTPTIRPDCMAKLFTAWESLFEKHNIELLIVHDGEVQILNYDPHFKLPAEFQTRYTSAVRNIGFAFIALYLPHIEYIITLDDDLAPIGDPIADHIAALNMRVPISWFPTTIINSSLDYMRGFPYEVRTEAEVVLSHGVWQGVPDYDAPTQLHGSGKVDFYKGAIPKGALFPMCGMNLAFKRKALPYMYFAPVGKYAGAERFDDIWCGIEAKKKFDELGWGVVTGYAQVQHDRASNVFKNLRREVVGIEKNEGYWKGEHDEWYKEYLRKRENWKVYIENGL